MFANKSPSSINSSTYINNDNSDNNFCSNNEFDVNEYKKNIIEHRPEIVIVTKHLCIPCPRLYSDIFKTILIVCKDPSHKYDKNAGDSKLNEKIQNFLNTK